MSRLLKHVGAELTSEVRPRTNLSRMLAATEKLVADAVYGQRYRIGVSLESRTTAYDAKDLQRAIEKARLQIAHEIFGEFVGPLRQAITLIHDDHGRDAAEVICQVLDCFYSDKEMPQ